MSTNNWYSEEAKAPTWALVLAWVVLVVLVIASAFVGITTPSLGLEGGIVGSYVVGWLVASVVNVSCLLKYRSRPLFYIAAATVLCPVWAVVIYLLLDFMG